MYAPHLFKTKTKSYRNELSTKIVHNFHHNENIVEIGSQQSIIVEAERKYE